MDWIMARGVDEYSLSSALHRVAKQPFSGVILKNAVLLELEVT
jgi:hypothetical protein